MYINLRYMRTLLKRPLILCLFLCIGVLVGCGFSQAQAVDKMSSTDTHVTTKTNMTENEASQLVPVTAVSFDGKRINVGVISFGCTTANDFLVEHAVVNNSCEIKIHRVNNDVCRRAPFVANIDLDWSQPEECSDLKLVVANPLLVTSDDSSITKKLK